MSTDGKLQDDSDVEEIISIEEDTEQELWRMGYGGLRTPEPPQPVRSPACDDRTAHTATLEILHKETNDPIYGEMLRRRRRRTVHMPSIRELPEHQRDALHRRVAILRHDALERGLAVSINLDEHLHEAVMRATGCQFTGYEEELERVVMKELQ